MQSGVWAGDWRRTAREPRARPVVRAVVGLLAVVVIGLGGWGRQAKADSGTTVTDTGAGLHFAVDTRWLDGDGYRPVRIAITPRTPTVADRMLSVEFMMTHWRRNDQPRRVVQDVEIPAGATGPIAVSMPIPAHFDVNSCQVRFLEDGREVAVFNGVLAMANNPGSVGLLPHLLIVGDSEPGTGGLAEALSLDEADGPYGVTSSGTKGSAKAALPRSLPTAIVRSAVELPQRWIEYTNCDLICLPLDELHEVKRQNPAAFQAILAWTSAGGNLLVHGVTDDWSRLADLESLLNMPPRPAGAKPALRGWTAPGKSSYHRPPLVKQRSPYSAPERKVEASWPNPPKTPPFLMREYDLGMVVAIASDAPLPGEERFWGWLLNSLGDDRWLWTYRHGFSTMRTNPEFWKFQIPGVGLPPLNAFRVLITLFVLAIGPLNYWLLRRRRQLQLLVVTIPLGAAAVTLALFGYALVADGLGTRVRVRSATVLDQRRGWASCWTRMSYYSGLTPSGGLTFPADVAVLPFDFVPGESGSQRQEMIWDEDQRLLSGWLPARTPTQLIVVRSRASDARLDVAQPGQDAGGLEVANRLGTRVEYLVVCGEDGKCYTARGVDAGASVRLSETAVTEARAALGDAYQANKLEYPKGLDPGRLRNVSYSSYSRRYRYFEGDGARKTEGVCRLEDALNALAPAQGPNRPLAARSYVAIVERSPEVVLGTPHAREEASFHVILGTW